MLTAIGGAFCTALALLMLSAWKLGFTGWLTFGDRFTPMMVDTALAVGLAGLGLIAYAMDKKRTQFALGIAMVALTLSSGFEYLLGRDFPFNDFLFEKLFGLPTKPMAPNTALALSLIGTAQIGLSLRQTLALPYAILVLAGGAIVLSLAALSGYIIQQQSLYGWANFTAMSPYTAIGILVLGALSMHIGLRQGGHRYLRMLAVLVAAIVAMLTLLTWDALKQNEERNHQVHIEHITQSISQAINTELYNKGKILERLAKRWERAGGAPRLLFDVDSQAQAQEQDFQALYWSDAKGSVRWVGPQAGNEIATPIDLPREPSRRLALAASRASRAVAYAGPIQLIQGGRAIEMFRALYANGKPDGYLSAQIRLDHLLERAAIPLLPFHTMASLESVGKTLTTTGYLDGPAMVGHHDKQIPLHEASEITVRVQHDAAYLKEQFSTLPAVVLGAGLIMACLTGATLWFWQAALMRARESEAAANLIRDHEARLEAIVETAVEGIITADSHGVIESFNPAAEAIFGYRADEISGRSFMTLLPEPHRSEYADALRQYLSGGQPRILGSRREITGLRKDGSVFPLELAVSEMHVGQARMFTGLVRDIGERKQAEAKIIEAKEAAEQASRAKSQFLSSMSHELRTPMNAIMGFAQLMELDDRLDAEQRGNIGEINRAGAHLLELINSVLDLSRIEAGKIEVKLGDIDADALLDECLRLSWPLSVRHGIHMDLIPRDTPLIHADRTCTKQILLNLISNAIKYNRKGGDITLSATMTPDGAVRLLVSDTGPGIPAEQMGTVFQPFNRAGREGSNIEGTGIGLTISQRLAHAMGGHIGCDSRLGEGSTFWVELPVNVTR